MNPTFEVIAHDFGQLITVTVKSATAAAFHDHRAAAEAAAVQFCETRGIAAGSRHVGKDVVSPSPLDLEGRVDDDLAFGPAEKISGWAMKFAFGR